MINKFEKHSKYYELMNISSYIRQISTTTDPNGNNISFHFVMWACCREAYADNVHGKAKDFDVIEVDPYHRF